MVSSPNKFLQTATLVSQLQQLASEYHIHHWYLGYSGGVDSQVLLHLLASSDLPLTAIYIDHGLQAESAVWAHHCEAQCAQLNIPYQCIAVNARADNGESPEAAARRARYSAFARMMDAGSCLLTAQHQQDQAETVLLQLMRGAGALGLSAMPEIKPFSSGWHARPLLNVSQQAILDYANAHQLNWVEDPSNESQQFDRNYLRHEIMPRLRERWPAADRTLLQFSRSQAEAVELMDELARQDLGSYMDEDNSIHVSMIQQLTPSRLRNALRYWLRLQHCPMPSRAVLGQIIEQAGEAGQHDTQLCVQWGSVEVRRFRDRLYSLKQLEHDPAQVLSWASAEPLELESIGFRLQLSMLTTSDQQPYVLAKSLYGKSLSVRFRQGGERIQPAGRQGHRDLKALFQDYNVPAWQRDRIPLIYHEDQLVAVTGYCVATEFACQGEGVLPVLQRLESDVIALAPA